MTPETARALNQVNLRFYRTRAAAFSASRESPWGGPVLDVACGNGRFGAALAETRPGFGPWLGVDASAALLACCRRRSDLPQDSALVLLDVVEHPEALPRGPWAAVVAFGLMHHVPGEERRTALLKTLASRLAPGGMLAVTLWRFGAFERFLRRDLPWQSVGVDIQDLEPGDHLLAFDGVEGTPRYCHFADEAETERLSVTVPFPPADRFRADGREGELNEYLVWERPR
jgi:SAM-dependent methyltransferase